MVQGGYDDWRLNVIVIEVIHNLQFATLWPTMIAIRSGQLRGMSLNPSLAANDGEQVQCLPEQTPYHVCFYIA